MILSFIYDDLYRKIVKNDEMSFLRKYFTKLSSVSNLYYAKLANGKYYVRGTLDAGHIIIYWSYEINDYRLVLVKSIYNISMSSNITPTTTLIFDSGWLDLYYNIFMTCNNFYIKTITDQNSPEYYKYFGDVMVDLVVTPHAYTGNIILQSTNVYNIGRFDYYTGSETSNILSTNDNVDNPTTILQIDNITVENNKNIYNYNSYNYINDDNIQSLNLTGAYRLFSIQSVNVYNSLCNIYNNITPITNFNIISINNELSFSTYIANNKLYHPTEEFINTKIDYQNINIRSAIKYDDSMLSSTFKLLVNTIITLTDSGTTYLQNTNSVITLPYMDISTILPLYNKYSDNIKQDIINNNNNVITDLTETVNVSATNGYSILRINNKFAVSRVNNYFIPKAMISDLLNTDKYMIVSDDVQGISTYLAGYLNWGQLYVDRFNDFINTNKFNRRIYVISRNQITINNYITPIYKNYIGGYQKRELYKVFPNKLDFTDSAVTQYRNIKYYLDFKTKIDNNIVNNAFTTPNRFKIYGCAIDVNLSDSNILNNLTTLNNINNYINLGKLVVSPYPIPLIISNVRNSDNLNLVPNSLLHIINTHYDIDNFMNNTSLSSTGIDIYNEKVNMLQYISDNTNINSFDKSLFIELNDTFLKYNFTELRTFTNMSMLYILHDTYTNNNTLFEIPYNQSDIQFHNLRNVRFIASVLRKQQYFQILDNQQFAIDTIYELFNVTKYSTYTDNVDHIYIKTIRCLNYTNINGHIDNVTITGDVHNTNTSTFSRLSIILDPNDWIIENSIAYVNLDNMLQSYEHMVKNITVELTYRKIYKIFSYKDVFSIELLSNIEDITTKVDFSYSATFIGDQKNQNIVAINTMPITFDNILPQVVYNKNISLAMFDIDENVWDLLPDERSCIVYNNFFNNTLDDLYIGQFNNIDTTQVTILDRFDIDYKKSNSYLKLEPILVEHNINKYCKIWVKLQHHELSDTFETFEYINIYNNTLTDTIKGTVIAEGKISDYSNGDDFEECFKLYKTQLLFTLLHNINNNITIPVDINITCELFSTFSDFTNNSDATIYDILPDQLLLNVKNRGEYIEETSDYYPKFIDLIEYYEIYPEYSWQQKKDYIHTLEMKLVSSDVEYVKVSELYFDILFGTEDLLFGIPLDYTANIDPENEIVDVVWLSSGNENNREYILDYINWLIRHKCPNCGNMVFKFKIKIKPSLYGFNVSAFMIGCYSHNVKLELKLQNIFYKESADSVFIIDEKQQFIEHKEDIPLNQKEDFYNTLNTKDKAVLADIGISSPQDINIKSLQVGKSINKMILFNSSRTTKVIKFTLFKNDTSKIINTTTVQYNFAPLELKIATITEPIHVIDYTNSYDSGIVLYKMDEIDVVHDTTTFIQFVNLAIPSVDSYITNMLSLINKTTEIVEVDWDINRLPTLTGGPSNIPSNSNRKHFISIKHYSYTPRDIVVNTGLQDVAYNFFINEEFIVSISHENINDVNLNMEAFGKNIFIKIPIILLKWTIESNDEFGAVYSNKLTPGMRMEYYNNNFINTDQHYFYLIGKRVDVYKYEFNLKALLRIDNNIIYDQILFDYESDTLQYLNSLKLTVEVTMASVQTLLNIIFNKNDISEYNYVIDNFVNGIIPFADIDDTIISSNSIVFTGECNKLIKKQPQFENISVDFNPQDAFVNVSNEYYRFNNEKDIYSYAINDEGELKLNTMNILGMDLTYLTYEEPVNPSKKLELLMSIHENRYFPRGSGLSGVFLGCVGCKSNTKCLIKSCCDKDNPHGSNGIDKNNQFSTNNAYELVFSEPSINANDTNIFLNLFKGSGVYELKFPIGITGGISRKHYIQLKIDGKYDQIISTKIATGGKIYPINYTGDDDIFIISPQDPEKIINYSDNDNIIISDDNFLLLQVSNMKLENITLITKDMEYNEIKHTGTNINYLLYKDTMEQLLASPLQITLSNDMATKPIIITADTNYKMIFEIPFRVNKVLEAYLVIDKVKVIDDFLHETDYCFMFNDTNERHFVKSNTSKLLNKTFYKYDNELRFLARMFNVPNQSGEHYSSIMVYYTFNGVAKVFSQTFRYRIVLPNVLDNEYLLVKQDRLDKPELMFDKKASENLVPLERMLVNDGWATSTTLGACGCNCDEYKFNWKTKPEKSTDTYYS